MIDVLHTVSIGGLWAYALAAFALNILREIHERKGRK